MRESVLNIYRPVFPLSQFVSHFTYIQNFYPAHNYDRYLPTGNIELFFDLTDHEQCMYDSNTFTVTQSVKYVWIQGLRNTFVTIPSKRMNLFFITFSKGMFYPFLSIINMPLDEITGKIVNGDLILTKEVLILREQLLSLATPDDRFLLAERYLQKILNRKQELNPFIDFSVKWMQSAQDDTSLQKLSGKIGYSQKHFIQIFRKNVGVTPKNFLQVLRFQKAIKEINRNSNINWAGLAYDCGYYDQSHFINDFKRHSGFTPEEYVLQKRELSNFIPIK